MLDIAFALDYAHREFMIVHRDLKPENTLYKNGTYKLSDGVLEEFKRSYRLLDLRVQ